MVRPDVINAYIIIKSFEPFGTNSSRGLTVNDVVKWKDNVVGGCVSLKE